MTQESRKKHFANVFIDDFAEKRAKLTPAETLRAKSKTEMAL